MTTPDEEDSFEEPTDGSGLPDGLGLGGMDIGGLLASAQEAMSAQANAAQTTVEGTSGGGVVKVTMTGGGQVTAVTLDPDVVDPDDIDMLQDLIVAAFSDASTKVADMHREALGALGQIDLGQLGGGLGGLLGGGSDSPDR